MRAATAGDAPTSVRRQRNRCDESFPAFATSNGVMRRSDHTGSCHCFDPDRLSRSDEPVDLMSVEGKHTISLALAPRRAGRRQFDEDRCQ